MATFSSWSRAQLATCHPDLVRVAEAAIQHTDFRVIEGHRGKDRQNQLRAQGASQVRWPRSKHNKYPSEAMDLAPWPIDWTDTKRFHQLAEIVLAEAERLRVGVTWGGHWTKFLDLPHYQLRR